MRAFVMTTFALAAALVPAVALAQPPASTSTAQPPAAQAAPPAPAAPKIPFTTPAAILLAQIKPDKTAVFEEMFGKLKAVVAQTQDATTSKPAALPTGYTPTQPFPLNALS